MAGVAHLVGIHLAGHLYIGKIDRTATANLPRFKRELGHVILAEAYELIVQHKPAGGGRISRDLITIFVPPHSAVASIEVPAGVLLDLSHEPDLIDTDRQMTGRSPILLASTPMPDFLGARR